jgi:cytochrome P450
MTGTPVSDWTTDYDIVDPDYVTDPFPIWDDLRQTCPIAHSDRWGGSWLPTTYAGVSAMAHDIGHFSSRSVSVMPPPSDMKAPPGGLVYGLPPIGVDPPVHTWSRRLLLPWFSHRRVEFYEPINRDLCNRLIDGFIETGNADAAADYAQQIPVRVIAMVLGVPGEMADTFTGWVRDILEFAHDEQRRRVGREGVFNFFIEQIA